MGSAGMDVGIACVQPIPRVLPTLCNQDVRTPISHKEELETLPSHTSCLRHSTSSRPKLQASDLLAMLRSHSIKRKRQLNHPALLISDLTFNDILTRLNLPKKGKPFDLPGLPLPRRRGRDERHRKRPCATLVETPTTPDEAEIPVDASGMDGQDLELTAPRAETEAETWVGESSAPNFFTLIRDAFATEGKASLHVLEDRIQEFVKSQRDDLGSWNPDLGGLGRLGSLGPDVILLALQFLSGEGLVPLSQMPPDFAPFVDFRERSQQWKWIGSGRDSNSELGILCQLWLEVRDQGLAKEADDNDLSPAGKTRTDFVVRPSTDDEKRAFQEQERKRYSQPHKAFSFHMHGFESVVGPVKGVFHKDTSLNKVREHSLLRSDRPAYVTILSLVRDAAARLPNGEGTRAEICELLKDSQYLASDVTNAQINSVVSGALDRLHYEKDPCVKYHVGRKIWLYLHRRRTHLEFERIHQAQAAAARAKKALQQKPRPPSKVKTSAKEPFLLTHRDDGASSASSGHPMSGTPLTTHPAKTPSSSSVPLALGVTGGDTESHECDSVKVQQGISPSCTTSTAASPSIPMSSGQPIRKTAVPVPPRQQPVKTQIAVSLPIQQPTKVHAPAVSSTIAQSVLGIGKTNKVQSAIQAALAQGSLTLPRGIRVTAAPVPTAVGPTATEADTTASKISSTTSSVGPAPLPAVVKATVTTASPFTLATTSVKSPTMIKKVSVGGIVGVGKAQATSTSLRIQGKEVSVAGPVLHSKVSTATTGLTRPQTVLRLPQEMAAALTRGQLTTLKLTPELLSSLSAHGISATLQLTHAAGTPPSTANANSGSSGTAPTTVSVHLASAAPTASPATTATPRLATPRLTSPAMARGTFTTCSQAINVTTAALGVSRPSHPGSEPVGTSSAATPSPVHLVQARISVPTPLTGRSGVMRLGEAQRGVGAIGGVMGTMGVRGAFGSGGIGTGITVGSGGIMPSVGQGVNVGPGGTVGVERSCGVLGTVVPGGSPGSGGIMPVSTDVRAAGVIGSGNTSASGIVRRTEMKAAVEASGSHLCGGGGGADGDTTMSASSVTLTRSPPVMVTASSVPGIALGLPVKPATLSSPSSSTTTTKVPGTITVPLSSLQVLNQSGAAKGGVITASAILKGSIPASSLGGLGRNIILTTVPAGAKLLPGNKPFSYITQHQLQQLQQQGAQVRIQQLPLQQLPQGAMVCPAVPISTVVVSSEGSIEKCPAPLTATLQAQPPGGTQQPPSGSS
uniref:nuclear factor related to kappa-B-binding protein-like isoform X3 n=1 Tax=Myxine glutinosa TaxID=7769 RepID=UPI00358F5CFD